jgi:hypothetical protein
LPLQLLLLLLLSLPLPSLTAPPKSVISTEAAHGLIVSREAERPPHIAFAVCPFLVPSQKIPQKYFQKVTFFRLRLRAIQKPHPHHKTPQLHHKKPSKKRSLSKTPFKNTPKPAQIPSEPNHRIFCKKSNPRTQRGRLGVERMTT